MITYERADNGDIKVRLNQRLAGRIKLAKGGGYYYQPRGGKVKGEVFPTTEQVKRSLEGDSDATTSTGAGGVGGQIDS